MNRLKALREEKDLLQKEVASYLNITQTGYSKYQTKMHDIITSALKALAKYYNVSIDYLLYLTD